MGGERGRTGGEAGEFAECAHQKAMAYIGKWLSVVSFTLRFEQPPPVGNKKTNRRGAPPPHPRGAPPPAPPHPQNPPPPRPPPPPPARPTTPIPAPAESSHPPSSLPADDILMHHIREHLHPAPSVFIIIPPPFCGHAKRRGGPLHTTFPTPSRNDLHIMGSEILFPHRHIHNVGQGIEDISGGRA